MEDRADHPNAKMTPAVASSRVPGVQMGFIDHLDGRGAQRLLETLANHFDARRGHGRTCLKGLTSAPVQAPDWM